MSKGKQKRGQCDVCPATKRVIQVRVHGERLNLCEKCRLELSRIERQAQAKKRAAAGAIVTAAEAGHL